VNAGALSTVDSSASPLRDRLPRATQGSRASFDFALAFGQARPVTAPWPVPGIAYGGDYNPEQCSLLLAPGAVTVVRGERR